MRATKLGRDQAENKKQKKNDDNSAILVRKLHYIIYKQL